MIKHSNFIDKSFTAVILLCITLSKRKLLHPLIDILNFYISKNIIFITINK